MERVDQEAGVRQVGPLVRAVARAAVAHAGDFLVLRLVPLLLLDELLGVGEQLVVLAVLVGFLEADDRQRRFVVLVAAAFAVDAAVVVDELLEILERLGDDRITRRAAGSQQRRGDDRRDAGAGAGAERAVVGLRLAQEVDASLDGRDLPSPSLRRRRSCSAARNCGSSRTTANAAIRHRKYRRIEDGGDLECSGHVEIIGMTDWHDRRRSGDFAAGKNEALPAVDFLSAQSLF